MTVDISQQLHYEAEIQTVVLRGCATCAAAGQPASKHPLAYNPPMPDDVYPDCGHPTPEYNETRTVKSAVRGGFLASVLLGIGSFLSQLSQRI